MDIVQFTDFHFGSEDAVFSNQSLVGTLAGWLKRNCSNPVMVISGDITFQGRKEGYAKAQVFFDSLIKQEAVNRSHILVCPGNHDIVDGSFNDFNSFAYHLRRDSKCSFGTNHHATILLEGVLFKLFNSSYHMDHTYGLIDESSFEEELRCHEGVKLAVTHHHLLNMFKKDTSAIRNSYDFLTYLDSEGFSYVFHGHQHAEQSYYLGKKPMRVISARSGNFRQKGYLNSINIYRLDKMELKGISLIFESSSNGIKCIEIEL
ncbi:metallophosphoesterase family protein [Amphritea sp.]|uniref:metallophosphoesterase family protein n=1 Tax=Amphritea sp. TaxID=1872502 RepID=UPI003A8F6AA3